jgi:hypothetical protein
LETLRQKTRDDEESIALLRSKVEESRWVFHPLDLNTCSSCPRPGVASCDCKQKVAV